MGRFHPSRTIVCAVEPRRTTIDAWASIGAGDESEGTFSVASEHVELTALAAA